MVFTVTKSSKRMQELSSVQVDMQMKVLRPRSMIDVRWGSANDMFERSFEVMPSINVRMLHASHGVFVSNLNLKSEKCFFLFVYI